jgi:DNA-binding CsgD family transcriptional regulator
MPAGNAAWYFVHSGYKLNSICFEVYGPESGEFMVAGGYHLLNDYASSKAADTVAAAFRPAMYGQQRDRMRPGAMNASSLTLFNVLPPQIGLKPAEQRVALHALLGLTDLQIASALGLSAETVRKAWVRIFAAADQALPAHFGSESTEGSRGPEKRRQLLEYLRVHMEELRPW